MAIDDALLLNLATLVAAVGLWLWKRPSGAANAVLLVVIAGTAFHFLTDIIPGMDLGEHGEHMLMHIVALVAVFAAVFGAKTALGRLGQR